MPETELVPETLLTPAPLTFIGEQLSPSPWQYRFTGEDALEIASYNSQTGLRVAVQGRMWSAEDGIRPFAFTHVPNTDRSRKIEVFGLPNGYLLNCVAFASSGAPAVAQTFVSVHVIRGTGQARVLLATLLQGYITAEQELGFPGSPLENSRAAGEVTRFFSGTDPAIGTAISEIVPTGARWRLRSIGATLLTSAAAGNRRPVLQIIGPAGTTVAQSAQIQTQPPTNAYSFYWMLNVPTEVTMATGIGQAGLPDITITNPGSIAIVAVGMDTSDNWTAPTIAVDEWLEAQ